MMCSIFTFHLDFLLPLKITNIEKFVHVLHETWEIEVTIWMPKMRIKAYYMGM